METNIHPRLLRQFNETIDQWILFLDPYPLEYLLKNPSTGSWSLGQVYIHIIDDTRYFIGQIRTALLHKANTEKEMHAQAKILFANNEFPDMQLEGPSTNVPIRQPQSKDELLEGLQSIKEDVNKLAAVPDFHTSPGKTNHPGFLFFTAAEWLQFAEMHMRHHFRQKKRIDEKLFRAL